MFLLLHLNVCSSFIFSFIGCLIFFSSFLKFPNFSTDFFSGSRDVGLSLFVGGRGGGRGSRGGGLGGKKKEEEMSRFA